MKFFKKLFGNSNESTNKSKELRAPDNARLIYLLDTHGQDPSGENYKAVHDEFINGNSFLLLPSANDGHNSADWETAQSGMSIKLSSVFNLDGLKVLGAFSDETALLKWAKRETHYTAIKTQDIKVLCEKNQIDRIVINSDQKNMFVLQRNINNFKTTTIKKETAVQIGKPIKPLNKIILEKLAANFKNVDFILEAYHYAQTLSNEFSLMIGVHLTVVSDNSRTALYHAVDNSLRGEKLDTPVDVFVIQTDSWLNSVRNIENSLFYKRDH